MSCVKQQAANVGPKLTELYPQGDVPLRPTRVGWVGSIHALKAWRKNKSPAPVTNQTTFPWMPSLSLVTIQA